MDLQEVKYPVLDGEPERVMRELRRRSPVVTVTLWNGQRVWLVTRLAEARQALTDPRLSTDARHPNFPFLNPAQSTSNRPRGPARVNSDRHAIIRKLLAGSFTARAARRWRRTAHKIAEDQLAMMLRNGPPADLVAGFAMPVPLRLICSILGLPEQDLEFIERVAPDTVARARQPAQRALGELHAFIEEVVRRNETAPQDGLVGQLVSEFLRTGAVTRKELADTLLILMVAGHVTTTGTIGLSVLSLLEEPARYRAIREDPGLIVPMVEEFLRLQSVISDGVPRVAEHDLMLGGVNIRAGEAVVISLASANRDETVFAGPDEPQPHRADVFRHIAFGWGAHRCLGQHLARMEVRVALATLAGTVPTLRLADPAGQVRHTHPDRHITGLYELPVTW